MSSVDALRSTWDAERAELQRSERVLSSLRLARKSLEQRQDELTAECARLHDEVSSDPRVALRMALEGDVEALQTELEAFGPRKAQMVREQRAQMQAQEAAKCRERKLQQAAKELQASQQQAAERREAFCARGAERGAAARSKVSAEVLLRAEEDAAQLRLELQSAESELQEMRQKLAASWVEEGVVTMGDDLENLEAMERNLQWLAHTQQEADVQSSAGERLERRQQALQRRLRELNEEKANLASARVDLGDAGKAMREMMASQSEGYVRHLTGLEASRKLAFSDRLKLMQDCADMQEKLDKLSATESRGDLLRGRHTKLQATCRSVAEESSRLREMNAALGSLLLSEVAEPGDSFDESLADVVMRALVLMNKLVQRQESYHTEREQLADRIRQLQRGAVDTPDAKSSEDGEAGAFANLRGRLGRLAQAARPARAP